MALKRIQDLAPASVLDGTELVELEQGGASVQCTAQDIADLGGSGSEVLTILTEASAFTATTSHAGLSRYIRAGGDVTFDSAESYTAGQVFNIRATASLELVEDGVTLNPTAGGTLDLTAGMAVTVVMTSPTTADIIGLTVAA